MGKVLVNDIVKSIEGFAHPGLQEAYDNCGLQVGDPSMECTGALVTLDVTPGVVEEAIEHGYNLVVSHHPLTLHGIKRFTANSLAVKSLLLAVRNNISIYAAHTNMDSIKGGVSSLLASRLGLLNHEVLEPKGSSLMKLVTFLPEANLDEVRLALFNAGAGHIGNYDSCSFSSPGNGTFRGGQDTNPFIGKKGEFTTTPEARLETIFPNFLKREIVSALQKAHPYEEPAYDIIPLANEWAGAGLGVIGTLDSPVRALQFLSRLKSVTGASCVRYNGNPDVIVKRVAVCGGSGADLISRAREKGAEVYVTADVKYHQFLEGATGILIADPGHFESEQFIKDFFVELIEKKIPNFAVRVSKENSNPVKYIV